MGAMQQANLGNDFDDLIADPEGGAQPTSTSLGFEDDWSVPLAEDGTPAKQSSDKPDKEIEDFDNLEDSAVNLLDEKEDVVKVDGKDGDKEKGKENDKDAGKDKDKEGKEKEEVDGKGSEEERETETPAITGKSVKLFQDGKLFEVPQDAVVKTKVDGKWEKVTLQDLRDNYSGKQAWDQKHEEIRNTSKQLAQREQEVTRIQNTIKSTLDTVNIDLQEALSGNKNPMEAVNKIIDMLNIDSYDFNKALFDSMTEELVTLDQMDEYERRAYWLEKRNEHLLKKHESFEEKVKESRTQEERFNRLDQLRQSRGVSEEDFVSAYEQLTQISGDNVQPEQVIEYAANLPYVMQAEELLTPYEDQLSDDEFEDMMVRIGNTMKSNKSLTKEDVASYLLEVFEVEPVIDQANKKAEKLGADKNRRNSPTTVPNQHDLYASSSYESFDDLNY